MPRWRWFITHITRRIWFRAALIAFLSVLLALAANQLAPLIPYDFGRIGSDAVDNVLTVLASSMLAVTTFSMTAMVTAFSGASQNGTPRATELLVEDASAQNALSTFLGAFLFSIVGIIALKANYYGVQGRAVLLVGTVGVIAWISIVLLRWIDQLAHFGRVSDTIERVERKAIDAVTDYSGPLKLSGRDPRHPAGRAACTAFPSRSGYVAHIDRKALGELAKEGEVIVHVGAPSGTFVGRDRPLAWTKLAAESEGEEGKDFSDRLGAAFTVRDARDFDQDPRFGITVLGEIASRALSPAVNDPGTAIAVLAAGLRVFDRFVEACNTNGERAIDDVVEPALSLEEMVRDLLVPIARDGAQLVEVQMRLQDVLGSVAHHAGEHRAPFHALARETLDRALSQLDDERDRERLCAAHEAAFGKTNPEPERHRAR
ncbi:DUF2254 domain-containing protein [Sphingomicrobium aestuariivivum]|uniref:DUF2254 domain-containing protein n=1 Tax=Sphingomicrobium aestuariivivum TaxID=1582356 RepID=UPI001FD706A2|nr:DUF2254 domain-containing protein [Sphingomicrobium aestuariivivum]MCJ8191221.1 DUF2254 domain-containing protein [Sphingomicrobium aestuariivivum]